MFYILLFHQVAKIRIFFEITAEKMIYLQLF